MYVLYMFPFLLCLRPLCFCLLCVVVLLLVGVCAPYVCVSCISLSCVCSCLVGFFVAQVVCAFWGFVFLGWFLGCLVVVCGGCFLFFGVCRGFCFVRVVGFGVSFLFGRCGSIVCFFCEGMGVVVLYRCGVWAVCCVLDHCGAGVHVG